MFKVCLRQKPIDHGHDVSGGNATRRVALLSQSLNLFLK
jgi:hypothetical protein